MQDNLTFSQQQADWAEQELREQKQLLQDLNPPLTNPDELKQWFDKFKPVHCDCLNLFPWSDRCTFCRMVIKCHNQLEYNIHAKKWAEQDARVKAYKEKLTPLSPEGWCPHCTEGLMDKNGNNDCDYNSYSRDGETGVDLHTHETTEHMILALPTKDWKKKFDFLGEGNFHKFDFRVVGKKMVTNGNCEACLEGLEEIRNQETDREMDISRWEDDYSRNHVYTCINGHTFNEDDNICMRCL